MPNGYRHLTESDRFTIQSLLAQGHSQRQVALALGVDPSTITRELQRTRRSADDPRCEEGFIREGLNYYCGSVVGRFEDGNAFGESTFAS